MGQLSGKVAIVTGASKGIGAGIAKGLAAAGASVVVNYANGKDDAERVVKEIVAKDGKAVAVQASVTNSEDVKRLFTETKSTFGSPSILVNNAGIYHFGPVEAVSADDFHLQFDTNVLGSLLTIQEALKYFGAEGGSIINVSSTAALEAPPGTVVYSATKAALDSVTRVLARELAPRKIRVNSLLPGPTETEGTAAIGVFESEMGKSLVAGIPLGRAGLPADIAPAAVFLASEASAWITGEAIRVSGGQR
jgi:3-oxoacyl-[acyl-carrier protein] reductase